MPRSRLASALLVLAALATTSLLIAAAPAAPRTNVVVYITDDESWLERSAYGWSNVPTPHFDRVARDGVLFTHGYTSAPSCAPSRASLLTGRNFWELEQGAFIQAWLPAKFPTLPDLFEAGGYLAGYTGKGWGPGVVSAEHGRKRNPAGDAYNRRKRAQRQEGINDVDYAANFEEFLGRRKSGQPFWFWVGCTEPHTPVGKDNPERLRREHGLGPDSIKVPGFLPDTPGVRRARAAMLYEVCHADQDLGRILKILEDRGELANTLLIVTADNGTQVLRSKTNVHDWGVRVPLAVLWPAQARPGRRVDDFVNFADLGPTMLAAAGLPVPATMSGRSILNLLTSSAAGRIDPARGWTTAGIEWHGEEPAISLAARMIRDPRYQYIVNYSTSPRRTVNPRQQRPDSEYAQTAATGSEIDLVTKHPQHPAVRPFTALYVDPRPREELYDCESDPWELKNLADSPAHAAIKARLRTQLEAYQRQTKDPRITGDMAVFEQARKYVLDRKFGPGGYGAKGPE